ncbi:MAG: beta-glucuronidase [Bacteroidales bacterium]|nr:beta-glucuronidase [Bacteroidales bacterium]
MKKIVLSFLSGLLVLGALAQEPAAKSFLLADGRDCQSLAGQWNYIVDPMDTGIYKYQMTLLKPNRRYFADRHYFVEESRQIEYDFSAAPTLAVPGDWNTQSEKLYYYEGSVWYRRTIKIPGQAGNDGKVAGNDGKVAGKRWFLYFGAVNYKCIVGLNNTILGEHKGGFTPFWFEVTDVLKEGENSLVVYVNNQRGVSEVPTVNFDWWNYGGITRDVLLVSVPKVFIRDYRLRFDGSSAEVSVTLDGGTVPVTVEIPELGIKCHTEPQRGESISFSFKFKKKTSPELWSPSNPRLYDIVITAGEDRITDKVGFRTIRTEGDKILLNGKPVFLKGIALHDETIGTNPGRCRSEEDVRALLEVAKDLGCNFLRLAHYPHSEQMVRLAEQMGFMLWEEIPCYWNIDWSSPDTYANAENQLLEMIGRDANRASVIIWSVANETPRNPERLSFLGKLIARARAEDPTRLVSAAMEKKLVTPHHGVVEDELIALTDLISFNQYEGWYDGTPADCDSLVWTIPSGKPVVISEFGGGARYGLHGDENKRFSEEYLALLYRKNLEMLMRLPGISGLSPWCLKDFRSPKRPLSGIQDEFNRKGVIDEQGNRKQAYYVLQDFYRR